VLAAGRDHAPKRPPRGVRAVDSLDKGQRVDQTDVRRRRAERGQVVVEADVQEKSQPVRSERRGLAAVVTNRLWGLAADVAVILYTLILVPPLVLAAYVAPRLSERIAIHWCRTVLWTAGAVVEVAGKERLPARGSFILVANHQSYFDICALVEVLGKLPRFVTKQELTRIPFFGQAVRALGQIVIDRADPESAKRAIDRAMRTLPGGVQVCFFAEGTRSIDGRIGTFKKGAVALGIVTGLPLIPVSISGTRKFMPKGSAIVRPGGRIRVVFGEPVLTQGVPFEHRDDLNLRLWSLVVREFDQEL
jgi:1-acyl-sn-glycerol-3-phosphate acyltransferase